VEPSDLSGVDQRLRLGVSGHKAAQSPSDSIRNQFGEAVERVVVVIGRVSAGCDGRGCDAGRHGSQW
jgi:hypothetical protein